MSQIPRSHMGGVPGRFFAVDIDRNALTGNFESHVVEDEEFWLGAFKGRRIRNNALLLVDRE